jgi:hypothetical protein
MGRHATEPIEPLDSGFGVPQPIAQVVSYMMAKNPAVRYQSAVDVANALGQYVDHSVVTPLPAMAVPSLPAYENAIMAKRARKATQAAATAPASVSVPVAAPGSTVPGQSPVAGQPATLAVPAGSPLPAATGEAAAAGSPQVPSGSEGESDAEKQGWLTPRNLFVVGGLVILLAMIVGLSTCMSCSSDPAPDDEASESADDEGSPAEDASGDGPPAAEDDPGTSPAVAPPPDVVIRPHPLPRWSSRPRVACRNGPLGRMTRFPTSAHS